MVQGAAFRILACFYDTDEFNFVDLCERAGYPTDLGGYYIRQLVKGNYLQKKDRGLYRIMPEGKLQIALYYGKHFLIERPRLSVLLVAKQQDDYLVLRRKVQPFMDVLEWPAGAVSSGESLAAAAARVAEARFGLAIKPEFYGFFRRIDVYNDKTFDDKMFAVHTCQLAPDVTVAAHSETGDNLHCTQDELQSIDRRGRALLDVLAFVNSGQANPEEHTYTLVDEDFGQITD